MSTDLTLSEMKKAWHGNGKSYLIGFMSSVILTTASFGLVYTRALTGRSLVYTILALGLTQAIVQMIYFLHLGQESKPRWQMWIFFFMLIILLIIVGGSLWIMSDLNDRVMSNMMMGMSHD